jgi:hypothetical protein
LACPNFVVAVDGIVASHKTKARDIPEIQIILGCQGHQSGFSQRQVRVHIERYAIRACLEVDFRDEKGYGVKTDGNTRNFTGGGDKARRSKSENS